MPEIIAKNPNSLGNCAHKTPNSAFTCTNSEHVQGHVRNAVDGLLTKGSHPRECRTGDGSKVNALASCRMRTLRWRRLLLGQQSLFCRGAAAANLCRQGKKNPVTVHHHRVHRAARRGAMMVLVVRASRSLLVLLEVPPAADRCRCPQGSRPRGQGTAAREDSTAVRLASTETYTPGRWPSRRSTVVSSARGDPPARIARSTCCSRISSGWIALPSCRRPDDDRMGRTEYPEALCQPASPPPCGSFRQGSGNP